VIISDLDRLTDRCNLYIALTRARKTVTTIGKTVTITVSETTRDPAGPSDSAVDMWLLGNFRPGTSNSFLGVFHQANTPIRREITRLRAECQS
jgi:hypothetical protein